MQYARLGNTGLLVSKLAFGAMTFGQAEGRLAAVAKLDQKGADALVGQALDAGVNFFNTADAYSGGQSEQMLAKALGTRRKDVVIATNETLDALNDLVRQGKVRYVGFSNWPAWLAAKALGLQRQHGWAEFKAAEMYYSLVGRDLEHEVVPLALDAGIGIMVWSPLAGGFLTGKYSRQNPQGDGGRLTGFDILPYDRERGYDLVDKLKEIALGHKATAAQVAIAWLLTRPAVAAVLVGATKPAQLTDNLEAANLALTTDELNTLDELTKPAATYPNWFNANIFDVQAKEALSQK